MWEIFQKTLPFFALIGLGYWAGRSRFFSQDATAGLIQFVFYFALSAMIFRFAASLPLSEILDWKFIAAYASAGIFIYVLVTAVAIRRGVAMAEVAVEAQCAVVGNAGFLGIPMLVLLMGPASVGPVLTVLIVDFILFGNLLVILITIAHEGRLQVGILKSIALGLLKNPMIVSVSLGMAWSGLALQMPGPADEFLRLLGGAATPGALFAIGASLAAKSAERVSIALWLSFCKLVLHPAAVAVSAIVVFAVEPFAAGVMIATAALPVAGNIYILAQHYGVAPQRVSAAILISTIASVLTVSIVVVIVSRNLGL